MPRKKWASARPANGASRALSRSTAAGGLGASKNTLVNPHKGLRIVRPQPETLANLRQGLIDRFRFVGVGGEQRTSDKIPDIRVLGVGFGCAASHLNRLVGISETAQQARLFEQARGVIGESQSTGRSTDLAAGARSWICST